MCSVHVQHVSVTPFSQFQLFNKKYGSKLSSEPYLSRGPYNTSFWINVKGICDPGDLDHINSAKYVNENQRMKQSFKIYQMDKKI